MKSAFPSVEEISNLTNNDSALSADISKILYSWHTSGRHYTYETALQALNTLLDGHGIESVDPEGSPDFITEGIRMCPPYSYVNMGDSYAATIAFDHKRERWVISCWADLMEEVEKEYKLGDYEEYDSKPQRCSNCHEESLTREFREGDEHPYTWTCDSCNHLHYAAPDYEPEDDCKNCGKPYDEHYDDECPTQSTVYEKA